MNENALRSIETRRGISSACTPAMIQWLDAVISCYTMRMRTQIPHTIVHANRSHRDDASHSPSQNANVNPRSDRTACSSINRILCHYVWRAAAACKQTGQTGSYRTIAPKAMEDELARRACTANNWANTTTTRQPQSKQRYSSVFLRVNILWWQLLVATRGFCAYQSN